MLCCMTWLSPVARPRLHNALAPRAYDLALCSSSRCRWGLFGGNPSQLATDVRSDSSQAGSPFCSGSSCFLDPSVSVTCVDGALGSSGRRGGRHPCWGPNLFFQHCDLQEIVVQVVTRVLCLSELANPGLSFQVVPEAITQTTVKCGKQK